MCPCCWACSCLLCSWSLVVVVVVVVVVVIIILTLLNTTILHPKVSWIWLGSFPPLCWVIVANWTIYSFNIIHYAKVNNQVGHTRGTFVERILLKISRIWCMPSSHCRLPWLHRCHLNHDSPMSVTTNIKVKFAQNLCNGVNGPDFYISNKKDMVIGVRLSSCHSPKRSAVHNGMLSKRSKHSFTCMGALGWDDRGPYPPMIHIWL